MERMLKQISNELNNSSKNELKDKVNKINKGMWGRDTEEDDEARSDDILEQAYNADTKMKSKELAKKALIIYPDNIDAMCFLAELENKDSRKLMAYNKAIEKSEELLKEYFDDSVGYFWGIIETRPYLRAKAGRVRVFIYMKKYKEALTECEDILRLNKDDNMGMRYCLVTLCCYLGEYDKLEKTIKDFNEDTAYVLFPKTVMYYKQGNMEKLKEYLKLLNESNKYIINMLIGKEKMLNEIPQYYSLNSKEEAFFIIGDAEYLIEQNPEFIEYLKENY